ncbi:MAG: hypothetical protein IJR97_04310 [Clostridia bacterium]|nr:hypothetical protein [Clostridia bacterium]
MEEFIRWLEVRAGEAKGDIARLKAQGRADDAAFQSVRANIYDACGAVTRTLISRPGAGVPAVWKQFEDFRAIWGAALGKAKQHGDQRSIVVEETKMAALEEIMARFREEEGK